MVRLGRQIIFVKKGKTENKVLKDRTKNMRMKKVRTSGN